MAIEAGREYNPETAMDLRPKAFKFEAYGETFTFQLEIPEYILARLTSAVMDQVQDYMRDYARRAIVQAIKGGFVHTDSGRARMASDVGKHLKNYIWERFSITQENAGNDCWQTAPTLQHVRDI